jgi:hypothetical protein
VIILEVSAMTSQRSVAFAESVRTAIGTFGGSPGVPAPNPRRGGDRCRGRACKASPRRGQNGCHGQCRAGRHQDESGPTYAPPGSRQVAAHLVELIRRAGFDCTVDVGRGLDHGAWVPLLLMYPKADIPALQLSIQPQLSPEHHLRVGRALEPLRHEGVLIIASGSFTHNLGEFRGHGPNDSSPAWVDAFAAWFDLSLRENRIDDLLNYRVLARFATKNHPTDEHLLPLYVALGAAGENARAARLHASATYSVLRMDVYAFDDVHDRLQALLLQHDALPECVTSRTTEPARGSTSI